MTTRTKNKVAYRIINAFWIDVGANDPTDISVTLLVYTLGGHGINTKNTDLEFPVLSAWKVSHIQVMNQC
jgi:hypothetical protein